MNITHYHFAVLRVMPNAMRGERFNIGLAVFHPDQSVSLHLDVSRERLKALDPNLSVIKWDLWATQARDLLEQLPYEARLNWLKTAFTPITADAELGWFRAANDQEVRDNIESLLKRLVSRPRRLIRAERTKGSQPTRLQSQLKNWFKAQHILGKSMDDLAKNRIVEEYPVSIDTDSYADFAFKNGALHIIETMDLRGVDHLTARLRNQAAFKSIVLDQARDVTQGGGQRIAILAASDYGAVKSAVKMIERNADDVVSMDNPGDVDRLILKLSNALHLQNQIAPPQIA
jgi:hypothetical protein